MKSFMNLIELMGHLCIILSPNALIDFSFLFVQFDMIKSSTWRACHNLIMEFQLTYLAQCMELGFKIILNAFYITKSILTPCGKALGHGWQSFKNLWVISSILIKFSHCMPITINNINVTYDCVMSWIEHMK